MDTEVGEQAGGSSSRGVARLDLTLVREDGATPFQRRFESGRSRALA
jgi:hypothetical protein